MAIAPEIEAHRKLGIGASDAAPICGVSPWKTPGDVWLEKKHPELLKEKEESPERFWGIKLEQVVAEEYANRTGQKLEKPGLVKHPKMPWLMCQPDSMIVGKRKGLEVKTADSWTSHQWGAAGTDEVPAQYLVQCQDSMMVTGCEEWDLAVLIGGNDFRIYHLFRSVDLQRLLFEDLKKFYVDYIIGNNTPEADWGPKIKEWLLKKYPTGADKTFSVEAEGSEMLKESLVLLRDTRDKLEELEKVKETQNSIIQAEMKECGELLYNDKGIRCTWTNSRDKTDIDWGRVYESIAPHCTLSPDEKQAIIRRFSTEKPGSRVFRYYDRSKKRSKLLKGAK